MPEYRISELLENSPELRVAVRRALAGQAVENAVEQRAAATAGVGDFQGWVHTYRAQLGAALAGYRPDGRVATSAAAAQDRRRLAAVQAQLDLDDMVLLSVWGRAERQGEADPSVEELRSPGAFVVPCFTDHAVGYLPEAFEVRGSDGATTTTKVQYYNDPSTPWSTAGGVVAVMIDLAAAAADPYQLVKTIEGAISVDIVLVHRGTPDNLAACAQLVEILTTTPKVFAVIQHPDEIGAAIASMGTADGPSLPPDIREALAPVQEVVAQVQRRSQGVFGHDFRHLLMAAAHQFVGRAAFKALMMKLGQPASASNFKKLIEQEWAPFLQRHLGGPAGQHVAAFAAAGAAFRPWLVHWAARNPSKFLPGFIDLLGGSAAAAA